jgi:glycosyltransferase involved in cell wall biosynthesis
MRVLLVGNYAPDAQQGMLRFAGILRSLLPQRGIEVVSVAPRVRWGVLMRGDPNGPAAKWLGYFDKYLLFPGELRRRVAAEAARGPLLVHVADHSNSIYVPRRPAIPWVVTCHDMLAVRGARGEATDCPASALGRRLQIAILSGLSRASGVACDSSSTLADLDRLAPRTPGHLRRRILLGQNHPYRRPEPADASSRLAALPGVPWDRPFLLHVGSNLARKNRSAVLGVLAALRDRWTGNAVFCGAGLDTEGTARARELGVERRVFNLPGPTEAQLEAVYSRAHALVFPSTCEGFGWPVIEAQACGCPVVASDRTSLPEVGGDGALYFAPDDVAGMSAAVLSLAVPAARAAAIERGLANAARFGQDRMVDEYVAFYADVRSQTKTP